jgi:PiT family inorganic phosphate transporter
LNELALVSTLIGVAVLFDFLNGFHDSSNVVATIISSRAMSPRTALALSTVAHFCAPFLFGVAVATTIGHDVVDPATITVSVILVALSSAIIWNLATWFLGIPSSSSHALIGGMVGAVSANFGLSTIKLAGLEKVLVALFLSPVLGLLIGYLLMKLVLFLARGASPKINWLFKRLQIVTSLALALTMGLVTTGYLSHFIVPRWVILVSALALSLGTAFGGWRIIRTLGGRMYRIRPIHGFTSQATSAFVILGAALLGGPVSTTHVVGSAIMGVGSGERLSKVRWGVASNIFTAWLVTIPVTALMAVLLCKLLGLLGQI